MGKPADHSAHLNATVPLDAALWLRDVMTRESRSLGSVIREAIDTYYRKREGKDPPWWPTAVSKPSEPKPEPPTVSKPPPKLKRVRFVPKKKGARRRGK